MSEEQLPGALRELLSGHIEHEDVSHQHISYPCFGLTWDKKKECWIVRLDGKRVMEVISDDFAEDADIRSYEFAKHILGILRDGGVDGLRIHIEELKCAR
jgi:hypothetical protein